MAAQLGEARCQPLQYLQ
jgi:hypothetical protein